jgi:hypothetical protein
MSSNNTAAASTPAAAAAAPAPRSKSAPSTSGFDAVSERLLRAFHAAAPPSSSKTANGVLNSAYRALSTSFSGSQGNVRGSKKGTGAPEPAPAVTPSISISRSSTRTRPSHMPSPLKFPSFDDPSDGTADNPSKLQTIERLDQVFVPLSAVSRDVRRLRIPEVLSATRHGRSISRLARSHAMEPMVSLFHLPAKQLPAS